MDIEQLTKSQMVLLALLVSFVTSIATGIVTVTLLDQAPPAVTQTISRVVERTIERVVPADQSASVVTKEITIVVKEEDLITGSIEKGSKSLVRITTAVVGTTTAPTPEIFLGLGFIIATDGVVVTDSSLVAEGKMYTLTLASGMVYTASVVSQDEETGVALLKISVEGEEISLATTIVLSKQKNPQLGQTVIALSGQERTTVAIGIIAGLAMEDVVVATEEEEEQTIQKLVRIDTTIDDTSVLPGSPLMNMFGEVVGLYSGVTGINTAAYTPVAAIKALLEERSAVKESVEESQEEGEN